MGDGVYEATRTCGHKLFKLDRHMDRLFRSLTYVRIDCGMEPAALERATLDLVERNMPLLGESDDFTVWHIISRGEQLPSPKRGPTVSIFCKDAEFRRFARNHVAGTIL